MTKIIQFFLSLKLTIILLVLMMVLVFAGTLAQVDQGIWAVVDQYFRCFIAKIDLHIFFPRSMNVPDVKIGFPGGFLLGLLLSINLITVHAANFKILATGRRKMAGLICLTLGVLVTCGVMFGWGTAPVAATEDDAFWRVFLRLGRGTLAAVVLFVASQLLYRKRAGMVLLHGGILFLLIGETITALFAVEADMTIAEGETVDFIDHARSVELAFIDRSDPAADWVTVIPDRQLRSGKTISPQVLPFDVRIVDFLPNISQPMPFARVPAEQLKAYPPYAGNAAGLYMQPQRENSRIKSAPAVDVELVDRATGQVIGRYLLALWFYPNFVSRQWDMPEQIVAGGKTYDVYLRLRREYLQSPSGHPYSIKLLDFVHEKYEGTQMPKAFSSRIRLVNEGDDVDRELRIWMNNPLRYARRTFFQSGYLPGDTGTVLQVVKNDSWMIPYLSCMIVFVGMGAQFIQSFGRYVRREQAAAEGGAE